MTRLSNTKAGLRIEDGKDTVMIPLDDLTQLTANRDLRDEVNRQLGRTFTRQIFMHKNRDGSVAIATGTTTPDRWPEDER